MAYFTDLNLSFKKHPGSNDVLLKTDVDAVKTSIKNVLLNGAFDVPFDPFFGANIKRMLFELASPSLSATVKRNVLLKLSEYEPRCVIQDIQVIALDNSLTVELTFYVSGNAVLQSLNLILERSR
jgi:hypothetical protein